MKRQQTGRPYLLSLVLGLLLVFHSSPPVRAQLGNPEEVLTLAVYPESDAFHPESSATWIVEIRINPPYHINSNRPLESFLIPTRLTLEGEESIAFGRIRYPEPVTKKFKFSENPLSIYEGTTHIPITLSFNSDIPLGETTVTTRLDFQGCTEEVCLIPMTAEVRTPVRIVPASVPVHPIHTEVFKTVASFQEGPAPSPSGEIDALFSGRGQVLPYLLIFLGGLALNLTPCVYPLIPITIGIFMMQGGNRRRQTVIHAAVYVLGMALTYSVLGLLAAMTGGMFGAAVQHPAVILLVAAILLVLSLGMFGLYDLRPPDVLLRFSSRQKSGYFGTLFMGLTAGIIAAPCVGPFVLGLLTFVGEKGNPVTGFFLFFIFALGLGTPFLFLGIFSQSLAGLPRSGTWLVWVKKLFGVILVGMTLYYLKPLIPSREAVRAIVYLAAFSGALYLILSDRARPFFSPFRMAQTAVAAGVAVLGISLLSPHPEPTGGIVWEPLSEERLELAQKEQKPVLIDFRADWCLPCLELERYTFSDPAVADRVGDFVALKADLTRGGNEALERLKNRFDVRGVPTVIFLLPDGTERKEQRVLGFVDRTEFLKRMETVVPRRGAG